MVEILSKAFGPLPDPVLLPWLPTLISTLKEQGSELIPVLTREAGRTFPASLLALDGWVAPWNASPRRTERSETVDGRPVSVRDPGRDPARPLLVGHPASTNAVAELLGCSGEWQQLGDADPVTAAAAALLAVHPATPAAVAVLVGVLDA